MFVLDTLLLSPIYATVWAARQVHQATQQERATAPQRITAELSELYMALETGRITEEQFAAREKELLDQLDRVQEPESPHPAARRPGKKRAASQPALRRRLAPEPAHWAT